MRTAVEQTCPIRTTGAQTYYGHTDVLHGLACYTDLRYVTLRWVFDTFLNPRFGLKMKVGFKNEGWVEK